MKKICFLLLPVAVLLASVISCSSAPQNSESASANAALDNIFARKSVRTYLNKGVEKEKIDLMLRAGMAAPSGKDLRPWEFYVITERASLDSGMALRHLSTASGSLPAVVCAMYHIGYTSILKSILYFINNIML